MIGLSLSFCVQDILNGKVLLDEVDYIIASTRCKDASDWQEVYNSYKRSYWAEFSDEQVKLVFDFLLPKIKQPRLKDNNKFPMITDGRWVESEDEITWANV